VGGQIVKKPSVQDLTPRREFLQRAGSLAAAALTLTRGLPDAATAAQSAPLRTRLILLGTGGGPRPKKNRAASSQAIVADGRISIVDCGDGVARQLAAANLAPAVLRHVFITHHHSDHNADYGNLLLLAWAAGLSTRVDTWGPPPLEQMTRLFFEMNAYDIRTRIADEARVPLAPLVHTHELTADGFVVKDDQVTVKAARVDHPPVDHALAFRFDAPDRAIVISGDTNRSDNLVRLAEGADVLVHEALWIPAVDRLVLKVPNATRLKEHIIASHTAVEDCGRVAAAAGVKTLVLSHLVPSDDPEVTDQMWIDAARIHFRGRVIVAEDLMEV